MWPARARHSILRSLLNRHRRPPISPARVTRHGNRWLRRILTQAAWAATHEKPGSYLKSVYRRIARRRGKKRALVAVAHAILVIAHCLLSTGAYYQDLGQDYFDHLNEERLTRYLVKRLESLGHAVELQSVA